MTKGQKAMVKHARAAQKKHSAKTLTKRQAKAVKAIVKGQAETKMVAFYGGPVAATSPPANSTGLITQAAPVGQNQYITSNSTDILKVIPDVAPGNADNERSGRYINPVSGTLRCKVMIAPVAAGGQGWKNGLAYDIVAVAYLLQSVSFKDYRNLYVENDFGKMLDSMDGNTTNFTGAYSTANLPVEKGYYKLLAKKRIPLRCSGLWTVGTTTAVTNNNSHRLSAEWTWNYKKHLPKKLIYPEQQVTVAQGQNEPLNSSIFWCVAYYQTDGTVYSGALPIINQEYTSVMKYKDF